MPPAKKASPPRRMLGRRKAVLRSTANEQQPPADGSTLPTGQNDLDRVVLTPSAMPPARRARPKAPEAEPSASAADAPATPTQATPGGRLVGGLGRVVNGIRGMLGRPPRSREPPRPAGVGESPHSRSPHISESLHSSPAPRASALRAGIACCACQQNDSPSTAESIRARRSELLRARQHVGRVLGAEGARGKSAGRFGCPALGSTGKHTRCLHAAPHNARVERIWLRSWCRNV